jgi:aminoglycoside 6'-N-acetyltransferase
VSEAQPARSAPEAHQTGCELRSARLRLRPLEAGDADRIAAYRSDAEVARFQSWEAPFSRAHAHALIASMRDADPGAPGWFQWAVELHERPGIVGDLGVKLHRDRRQATIGYTIAAGEQRRGYGGEAVARMLEHLFAERGLHRVSAECDARNAGSVRLLEGAGFRREGHLVASARYGGEWCDELLYGLLAREWSARTAPGAPT